MYAVGYINLKKDKVFTLKKKNEKVIAVTLFTSIAFKYY